MLICCLLNYEQPLRLSSFPCGSITTGDSRNDDRAGLRWAPMPEGDNQIEFGLRSAEPDRVPTLFSTHLPLGGFTFSLFLSLPKFLFNFPSQYLPTIGLVPEFSLGCSLPPNLGCVPKQPDYRIEGCSALFTPNGPGTLHRRPRSRDL